MAIMGLLESSIQVVSIDWYLIGGVRPSECNLSMSKSSRPWFLNSFFTPSNTMEPRLIFLKFQSSLINPNGNNLPFRTFMSAWFKSGNGKRKPAILPFFSKM